MTTPDAAPGADHAGRRKAVWWLSPTLLEPVDGPWGAVADLRHAPVEAWKRIIDWASGLRVDTIITTVEPFRTDRVVINWPFHYVCRFPDDPAARCFDDGFVEQNIDQVRQILDYGLSRSVRFLIHHYNCMAPERWVDERPSLAQKLDAVDDPAWGRRFHCDRLGFLVGNVCWSDPEYRQFLNRCWAELIDNLPQLAGLMITAGEFNYCRCPECAGGGPAPDIFSDHLREAEPQENPRANMCLSLIGAFQAAMTERGKESLVRTWCMEPWRNRLPRGRDYVIKYSLNDACWAGPDPVVRDWIGSGHRMWVSKAIEAENSGPIIWHDEGWCRHVGERLNALQTAGTIVHLNPYWGHDGLSSFVASRNITRLLEQLEPRVPSTSSERELSSYFGESAGPVVVSAASAIAGVPLNMTGIVHLRREGFTYGLHCWFDGPQRWPGVLGTAEMDAPDWARPPGLMSVSELMLRAAEGAEMPGHLSAVLDGRTPSVIGRLDKLEQEAADAVAALRRCRVHVRPEARGELAALIAGGEVARLLAREYAAVLRARIAWHVVERLGACQNPPPEELKKGGAAAETMNTVLTCYRTALDALRSQLGWAMRLAGSHLDFVWHIAESRETFSRFPIATRLKIRQAEYAALCRACKHPNAAVNSERS